MSTTPLPFIQLFVRGSDFLFDTNGSSVEFADSKISPSEFYNDPTNPLIDSKYVKRDAAALLVTTD